MLNKRSNGGCGSTSIEDNLEACFLACAADIGAHCHAFADSAALVAATFVDPTSWSSCKSPAFASTAAAWEKVTGAYTFRDMAVSGLDKGVYAALTGTDVKTKVDVKAAAHPRPLISNLLDVAGKHSQRAFSNVLLRKKYLDVVNDTTVSEAIRHRFRQAAVRGAGRFQSVIPDASGYLDLDCSDYMSMLKNYESNP